MKRHKLGQTGIEVSEICFGTLTLGPLQRNFKVKEALPVLERACEAGINFYDTADMYKTYPYIHELLKRDRELVVCSRSYDYTAEGVEKSLNRALRGIGRDYIDLYLLHEQESRYTFEGHWEAVEALIKAKSEGKVRALGVSTHRVEAVRDILDFTDLEVVFALINPDGLGIEDGSAKEMKEALRLAKSAGKAVMGMKPFGGGNLLQRRGECLEYAKELLDERVVDSVAFGMQSIDEVDFNTGYFNGLPVSKELQRRLAAYPRQLHIDDWCEGCGSCVKKCHQKAIHLEGKQAVVDTAKCLTCGYCASVCPVFAIKVI